MPTPDDDKGINLTHAEGIRVEDIIIARACEPTTVAAIADLMGFRQPKVRRILRTLASENRIMPSGDGWVVSNAHLGALGSMTGKFQAKIAELREYNEMILRINRLITGGDEQPTV